MTSLFLVLCFPSANIARRAMLTLLTVPWPIATTGQKKDPRQAINMLGRVSVEFKLRHYHMLETDSQLKRDDLSHDKPFPVFLWPLPGARSISRSVRLH